ncbi:MAG TPA: 50S ribosomal protein L15 [bacterium]
MKLHELKPAVGSTKKNKRVARGPGSGHGKTSTRGHKGQNSRTGGGVGPLFEGGQMPLIRRLPKIGFVNIFRKEYAIVNIDELNRFNNGTIVDPVLLKKEGVIKNRSVLLKILGNGELKKSLTVKANKFSESAKKKIEAAGGKTEVTL